MKIYNLIVLLSITYISCVTSPPNNQYFEYDKIEHYYLEEPSEIILKKIHEKDLNTEQEKSMLDLYFGRSKFSLSDSAKILDNINSINYTVQNFDSKDVEKLREIFRDREIGYRLDNMCLREYRDILVFKQRLSIVGIALICFKCEQSNIIGSHESTVDFGQKGNYEKLHKILYKR